MTGSIASRLAVVLGLLPVLWSCGGKAPSAGGGQPHLLLVTLDTVRADHLGAYGAKDAETPVLDGLAARGLRFETAVSPAPLTLPSHASLLTGLLPPRHGLRNNGAGALPKDLPTLATVLSAAGYRTGAFVSAFVLDRRFGISRGFDRYDDEVSRDVAGALAADAERPADQTVDRALAWLAEGEKDPRPFFLWIHLYDAHAPYAPPEPFAGRHPGRPYDGEIAFADQQLGRLLAELERRGLAGRTVTAVTADHGEALGEHGELTHGLLLYEPTLRVPLLVAGPGLPAGRALKTPAGLVDLGPTLAGLLGRPLKPVSGALDGRDLSAALRSGSEPPAGELYSETRYPMLFGWSPLSALRRRSLKYIAAPRPELYDLGRDPAEAANLLPQAASSAAGLAARLSGIEAAALASPAPAAPGGAMDAETRARLESLGYAAGGSSPPPAAGGPAGADPKDRVELFRRYEAANSDLRAGRPAKAKAVLAELVAADPDNPIFRAKLGQAYRDSGQLAEAVPFYRDATAATPNDPEAWYNLGVALQQAGQPAPALSALERSLQLDPGQAEAHNTVGILRLDQGELAPARQAFEQAIALDPANARAFNNLGNVLRSEGNFAAADQAYRKATVLAPRYAEPWNGLGTVAVELNQPVQALQHFDQALALAPQDHEVRLNRAIALEVAGNIPAAISAYRDFLAAAGENPHFAQQRKMAQQLLGRLSERQADRKSSDGRR